MNQFKDINQYDTKFQYMFLSRLQGDCEYFLGYGNNRVEVLPSKSIRDHIDTMIAFHENFPEGEKPEWLTMEQIREYESKMLAAEPKPARCIYP